MPELPEVEALRRALDDPVRAFPIERAGPAHVATLKTFDPPLATLEGRRLAGAERRAKRLLFPTEDGELVLLIHLMSAGRVRYLGANEAGPKKPAFGLRFEGGGQLVLTEAGAKKRAGVWLLSPEAVEQELEHLGPEALGLRPGAARGDPGERAPAAALAPARPTDRLRDRPRVGERDPAHGGPVPFRPGPGSDPGTGPNAGGRDRLRAPARPRATRARREGHEGLPRPQEAARALPPLWDTDRARRLRRAHDLLLPELPNRWPRAQGSPALQAAAMSEHALRSKVSTGQFRRACGRSPHALMAAPQAAPRCQTGGRVLKDRRLSRLLR